MDKISRPESETTNGNDSPNNNIQLSNLKTSNENTYGRMGVNKPIAWTKDHEKILIDWADKALCYKWLHSKSNTRLSRMNTYFTIPVIVMSTITGTANFAQDRVPMQYRGLYSMAIGGVNIFAGIITTIQQFLKVSELNEAHRVSAIAWDKFYRKIRVELSKSPHERLEIYEFLKSCTEEFDRLMETSPIIDKVIIQKFNKTFNETTDETKRKMFKALKKPEICDSLESVKFSIYKEDTVVKKESEFKYLLKQIVNDAEEHSEKQKDEMKMNVIEKFVDHFKTEMLRPPNRDELINNLCVKELNITHDQIDAFIEKFADKLKQENKN